MSNKQNTNTKSKGKAANGHPKGEAKPRKQRSNRQPNVKSAISVAPLASAFIISSKPPVIKSNDDGSQHINHTEMVGPVFKPPSAEGSPNTEQLYTALRLRCNPGSQATFAWLSAQANLYESFIFEYLEFIFISRKAATSDGAIIMSPDYDAADGEVATTEKALFNNKGTVDGQVWKNWSLKMNTKAMNRLYKAHVNMSDTRFESTKQDQKTIDPAQVFILIDDLSASANKYGKLYVKYRVKLMDPQMVTEPANQGGFLYKGFRDGANLLQGSTKPLSVGVQEATAKLNIGQIKIDPGVFKASANLAGLDLPTATLGQFIKDTEAIITGTLSGTGVTGPPGIFCGKDPNIPAGNDGDVPCVDSSTFPTLGSSTVQSWTKLIQAQAGDYLKLQTPVATTLTNFAMEMAGVNRATSEWL